MVQDGDGGDEVRVAQQGRRPAVGVAGCEQAAELRRRPGRGPPSASAATAGPASAGSLSRQAAQLATTSSTQVRQASASGSVGVAPSAPVIRSSRAEPPGPATPSSATSIGVGYRSRAATVTACRACASHRAPARAPPDAG